MLCAQQERQELQDQDALPSNAVWRIGEFGKTPSANGIYRLRYSRDGRLLATRNRENVVAIYDTQTKKKLCEVQGHDNNWIETIDFSPDSTHFVTAAGSSEKVKVWNTQNGKLEAEIETDGKSAYFSDDGRKIFVLGLTHVETYSWPGVQVESQKKWRADNAERSAMSQDGRLVVMYQSVNRKTYQTQVLDLTSKSKIDLAGPTDYPKSVVISPNHLWVAATYNRDANIRLWDLRNPHKAKYVLKGHQATVQSLSFTHDSRLLISSGWDEKAIAWDLLTRQPIGTYEGHTEHVNATATSPIDWTFATGASGATDTSTIIWDLRPHLFPSKAAYKNASFEQLWKGMGANFVTTSLGATTKLMESPDQYIDQLAERIATQTEGANIEGVVKAIQELDDSRYQVRENATNFLMTFRGQADSELRKMLTQSLSTEMRYRINRILKQPVNRPKINFPELRRWHRIILALEMINTPQAVALLTRIAAGHPDIDVAQDAEAALKRNTLRATL